MANKQMNMTFRAPELTEIHVDGSDDRVILLDTTDIGVITRFRAAMPEMDEIDKIFRRGAEDDGGDDADAERIAKLADDLRDAEKRLAEIIDGIFNADVCAAATGGASLYTPCGGYLLYEVIVSKLAELYGDEMQRQAKMRHDRIAKHTNKYHK